MKRIPGSPALQGWGLWSQHPLLAPILHFLIKALFPLSGGITRLVHFHKNLENLLFLKTSVTAGLTAVQGGSGDGTEQRQHCDVPRAGLKPEWNLCTPREK